MEVGRFAVVDKSRAERSRARPRHACKDCFALTRAIQLFSVRGVRRAKQNIMRAMASSGHSSDRSEQVPDFELHFDSAPALIHTSVPDGYLDFLNQNWLNYVGLSLEDLQSWKWTGATKTSP
jgi:hypothetical protein